MDRRKQLLGGVFLLGGILGVVVVRYFFLIPIEVLGWKIFWHFLIEGKIMNLDAVAKSSTFLKCLIGFLVGGVILRIISEIIYKTFYEEKKQP
ncbi:MAG: hypothetical protein ABIJ11_05000 [Elusimicrobiota bacterium]